jgi:hypothetical protein
VRTGGLLPLRIRFVQFGALLRIEELNMVVSSSVAWWSMSSPKTLARPANSGVPGEAGLILVTLAW